MKSLVVFRVRYVSFSQNIRAPKHTLRLRSPEAQADIDRFRPRKPFSTFHNRTFGRQLTRRQTLEEAASTGIKPMSMPQYAIKHSSKPTLYWVFGLVIFFIVAFMASRALEILAFIHQLDILFTHSLNSIARRNRAFDEIVFVISAKNMLKMVPLVTVLWWAWFSERTVARRETVIKGLLASMVAVALARTLIFQLPMRLRPLHDPTMNFIVPYGPSDTILEHWSSFPSDHAAVACALATAIFICSRRLGIIAFIWAALVIALPRVYLGFHYLSDVICGGAIGVLAMLLLTWLPTPKRLLGLCERLEVSHSGVFYAALFFITYQLGTMFEDVRSIGHQGVDVLLSLLGKT